MGTRETRRQRGLRRGEQIVRSLVAELRSERQLSSISQRALARELECSQSELNRLEQHHFLNVSIPRLSEIAALLGLELSISLHRVGEAIRDRGQEALITRFAAIVNGAYRLTREVLLPVPGSQRSWDVLLRLVDLLVGVEAETRIRDVQALVRRIRLRERDGGVDAILLVLSDTVHNRALVGQLVEALGPRYATPPRQLLAALRAGRPVPGSGVILL